MSHWSAPNGLFADTNDVAGVFRKIYDDRVWGGGSGIGSDPNVARPYLYFLQNFLIANDVGEATETYRSALLLLGFVLFIVTFVVLAIARLMLMRLSRKEGN